jgi:acetyl esterase/lipase
MEEAPVWPDVSDADAWRKAIKSREDQMLQTIFAKGASSGVVDGMQDVAVEDRNVADVPIYIATPPGFSANDRRVYLEFHGGGYIQFGGYFCRMMAMRTAAQLGVRVWSVDYRMPPDHPFPAALDDALVVYKALLEIRRPKEIIVGGASAGGNLTAATILRARDEGLPLPAAAVMDSPILDLTESGDTWSTNLGIDNIVTGRYTAVHKLYAGGHDLRDPYISPVFGDYTKGFSPSILTTGTRDILLSDSARMQRALYRAGVPVELHVWEAASHAKFLSMAPEDKELGEVTRRFCEAHWG